MHLRGKSQMHARGSHGPSVTQLRLLQALEAALGGCVETCNEHPCFYGCRRLYDAMGDTACVRATRYFEEFVERARDSIDYMSFEAIKEMPCSCDERTINVLWTLTNESHAAFDAFVAEMQGRGCDGEKSGAPDFEYLSRDCITSALADMLAQVRSRCALRQAAGYMCRCLHSNEGLCDGARLYLIV